MRTAILLAVAGGLAVVLAIVGYLVAPTLVEARMASAGIPQVVLTSPKEPRGVALLTGLQFAWPAIAAAVAIGLERWRSGNDPPVRVAVLYFVIPAVVVGGYTALQIMWLGSAMGQGSGITPMIALRDLGPTARDAQLLGFVSLVMWLYVWVRRS